MSSSLLMMNSQKKGQIPPPLAPALGLVTNNYILIVNFWKIND